MSRDGIPGPGAQPASTGWRARLQRAWQARTLRERRGLLLAALLIGATLLWQAGLAPALHTWRDAAAQQARLDAERQQLLQLQRQARQLQALPRIGRDEALRWLQGPEVAALGPGAVLQVQGEQVLVQLQAAPPEGLSRWLRAAREQARALPVQVQLQQTDAAAAVPKNAGSGPAAATRGAAVRPTPAPSGTAPVSPAPSGVAPADSKGLRWRGSLVLRLPA